MSTTFVRLVASIFTVVLLATVAFVVWNERVLSGGESLLALLAIMVSIMNLVAIWYAPRDREERRLETEVRKAELRRRLHDLEGREESGSNE
jgi:hypothetical protein